MYFVTCFRHGICVIVLICTFHPFLTRTLWQILTYILSYIFDKCNMKGLTCSDTLLSVQARRSHLLIYFLYMCVAGLHVEQVWGYPQWLPASVTECKLTRVDSRIALHLCLKPRVPYSPIKGSARVWYVGDWCQVDILPELYGSTKRANHLGLRIAYMDTHTNTHRHTEIYKKVNLEEQGLSSLNEMISIFCN